jgi:cob(I)alamin adenosyltransferase
MTSFYTRTGDDGFTGLLGQGRVPKYHAHLEAVGALDEATAAIGVGRANGRDPRLAPLLIETQRDLYRIMSEISATPENVERFRSVNADRVAWLEARTDELSAAITLPNEFILPGDSPAGSALSLARAIVRRAERITAQLFHSGEMDNREVLRYLNRLSSLLFVLELVENQAYGKPSPTLAKSP